jgi:hypothetical protein
MPTILFLSLCIASIVNFGINANFRKSISWPFDAHSETILDKINSEGIAEKRIKTIDFSWPFESSFGYYISKNKYSNLQIVKDAKDREKLNASADYYIYYGRSMDKVGYLADKQLILNIKKDTAWSYESEDVYVFSKLDTLRDISQ